MKKILKYSLLAVLAVAAISGCKKSELDTDQFNGFSLAAIAPNPVMRGGELRIVGGGLENATEVKFAGNVTVTDITVVEKGSRSEIRVMVPLEGPEVGKVTVVGKDGRVASTKFDLTFSEPISIDSFTPEVVRSGDVLTFKGEYLNDVKTVIFSDDIMVTDFESQSRHELSVKVPFSVLAGPVILSDVDEITDQNTIPNHIYTEKELGVGTPVIDAFTEALTVKAGQIVTVTGEHLDMIKTVSLPNAEDIAFMVEDEGEGISFTLPAKAQSGKLMFYTFNEDVFEVGEIEAVVVTDLSVKSLSEDQRFKAGYDVEITGSDLDLVTSVMFGGDVEASFYYSEGSLITSVPAEAKDGRVTVTLESGVQAFSEELEVVKPEIRDVEYFDEYVAGKTVVTIVGEDLDLVTSVTIGDKDNGLIPCEFELVTDELGYADVKVALPEQAYTGPITFTSAAGYQTSTNAITITYDMAVSVKFGAPSFGLGQMISIKGANLLQVDQVFIKGKRVTSFAQRADDAMVFAIPDGIGPGVYRLNFVLMDGTELTWPVPFEITAPFTEKFIWEGYEDLGEWSNQPYLGAEGAFTEAGITEGDVVRVYFTPLADDWQFQAYGGHWDEMHLDELGGGKDINAGNCDASTGYFAFNVTAQVLAQLTSVQGWGGSWTCNGQHVAITGLSLIHFGAAEKRTTIWEGSTTVGNWDGSMGALSWGGYDWSTVQAGTKLAVSFTASDDNAVMRFGNGSWASMPSLAGLAQDGNIPIAGLTSYEFELTDADIAELVNNGGLVICGAFWTLTEVALVTMEGGGPVETAIWEGNSTVTWSGGAVTDLSWGGYDWTTVEAGTVLCLHYTIDDPEGCIRIGNGSWASIPSLAGLAPDGNLPLQDGGHEVELTAEDVNFLIDNGGLVICGTGYTITQIGLK